MEPIIRCKYWSYKDVMLSEESKNPETLVRIGRTYRFESAHYLPLVPDGHKCKNLHGHNYRMEIVLQGKLDARGFVTDFAEIDQMMIHY